MAKRDKREVDQPAEVTANKPVELVHAIDAAGAAVARLELLSTLIAGCSCDLQPREMEGLAYALMSIQADIEKLLELV